MPTENQTEKTISQNKTHGALIPLIIWILFAAIFFGISLWHTPNISDITHQQILSIFTKYAQFGGIIFGLLSMILMYVFYIIRRIVHLHTQQVSTPILAIFSTLPWAIFGYQLVFHEPRYTALAKAIISFLGEPMLYTSCVIIGINAIWTVVILLKKSS